MSLAVVLPVPLDASAGGRVGGHLREAIRKVNNGEYGDAVTEARKAIDAMDGRHGDGGKVLGSPRTMSNSTTTSSTLMRRKRNCITQSGPTSEFRKQQARGKQQCLLIRAAT
jgi:hypothetical protein